MERHCLWSVSSSSKHHASIKFSHWYTPFHPQLSLSYLTHIDLHNNSLTGTLPDLCHLDSLETVHLGHNNFTEITTGCLTSSNIQTFNLSNNLNIRSWMFPGPHFEGCEYLQYLDLEATNMEGDIQLVEFGSFPDLHTFVVSHNNLTGTLPVSLGTSKVKYLRFNDQGEYSGFSGRIDVISSMSNLSQAWLQNNTFTGPIPNMSNCTHLFDLQLQSNSLISLVPPSLLSLSSLKDQYLSFTKVLRQLGMEIIFVEAMQDHVIHRLRIYLKFLKLLSILIFCQLKGTMLVPAGILV